jgi:hypothetical protein
VLVYHSVVAHGCRSGLVWSVCAQLKAEESGLEAELAALDNQEEKSTIELVFSEIDVDNSGELTGEEFSKWWLGNGGDTERLATVQKAFEIIEMRDGKPGCTIGEFAEVRHRVQQQHHQQQQPHRCILSSPPPLITPA